MAMLAIVAHTSAGLPGKLSKQAGECRQAGRFTSYSYTASRLLLLAHLPGRREEGMMVTRDP